MNHHNLYNQHDNKLYNQQDHLTIHDIYLTGRKNDEIYLEKNILFCFVPHECLIRRLIQY